MNRGWDVSCLSATIFTPGVVFFWVWVGGCELCKQALSTGLAYSYLVGPLFLFFFWSCQLSSILSIACFWNGMRTAFHTCLEIKMSHLPPETFTIMISQYEIKAGLSSNLLSDSWNYLLCDLGQSMSPFLLLGCLVCRMDNASSWPTGFLRG